MRSEFRLLIDFFYYHRNWSVLWSLQIFFCYLVYMYGASSHTLRLSTNYFCSFHAARKRMRTEGRERKTRTLSLWIAKKHMNENFAQKPFYFRIIYRLFESNNKTFWNSFSGVFCSFSSFHRFNCFSLHRSCTLALLWLFLKFQQRWYSKSLNLWLLIVATVAAAARISEIESASNICERYTISYYTMFPFYHIQFSFARHNIPFLQVLCLKHFLVFNAFAQLNKVCVCVCVQWLICTEYTLSYFLKRCQFESEQFDTRRKIWNTFCMCLHSADFFPLWLDSIDGNLLMQ